MTSWKVPGFKESSTLTLAQRQVPKGFLPGEQFGKNHWTLLVFLPFEKVSKHCLDYLGDGVLAHFSIDCPFDGSGSKIPKGNDLLGFCQKLGGHPGHVHHKFPTHPKQ